MEGVPLKSNAFFLDKWIADSIVALALTASNISASKLIPYVQRVLFA